MNFSWFMTKKNQFSYLDVEKREPCFKESILCANTVNFSKFECANNNLSIFFFAMVYGYLNKKWFEKVRNTDSQ